MRPSAPRSQQLWRQIRSALGIGTAAATGSASLLWRNNVLACEEEGKQQHSESTLSKIKTSLTPASALAFQKRLEDWNKSFDDLVLLSQRLYSELSFADDSLARHIVDNDRLDKQLHPELDWDARVRLSDEPCFQERAFFRQRQRKIRVAYAKLLQVPEDEVDVRDLPVFGWFDAIRCCVSDFFFFELIKLIGDHPRHCSVRRCVASFTPSCVLQMDWLPEDRPSHRVSLASKVATELWSTRPARSVLSRALA